MNKLINRFDTWLNLFMATYPRLGIVAIIMAAIVLAGTFDVGARAVLMHHREIKRATCRVVPMDCLMVKNTIKGRRNIFRTDNDDRK